jgi:heptosyltransferase-2
MVGVQKDTPVGEQIEKWLSENSQAGNQGGTVRLKNWMGKTSMGELIDLLRGCDALLTNDTGTMHLAVMLGVPVVSVFGSTDPAATGPVGPNHRVLQHKVPCGPCFLRECPKDFACMEKVTVQEVVEAVEGTLKGLLSSKKVLPADGSDLMLSSL